MASSSLIFFMIIFSTWLLISSSESTEHIVGDSTKLWKVPLASEEALVNWASNHHFTIGDTIVFKYNRRFESVHEVTERDYGRCITKGPYHKQFHGGNTRVVLDKLGTRYFVSGRRSHCLRGLKLAIVVMPPSPPPSLSLSLPSQPSLALPLALPASLLLSPSPSPSPSPSESPSPSPSPSPSESPSPSPNSSGSKGGANGRGFIVWLGVSLAILITFT